MKLSCPHCDQRMHIRTSRRISLLLKEAEWQCVNIECGHTCVSYTEIVRTRNPSQRPNPKVFLRVGKGDRQTHDPRQLDLLDKAG